MITSSPFFGVPSGSGDRVSVPHFALGIAFHLHGGPVVPTLLLFWGGREGRVRVEIIGIDRFVQAFRVFLVVELDSRGPRHRPSMGGHGCW